MARLDKERVLPALENLLERIENGKISNVLAYEKDALKQVIEQYETSPMHAYWKLEDWFYTGGGKVKPTEIKSAMLWGALWVMNEMDCIDWNNMKSMYGEFMSKQMSLR